MFKNITIHESTDENGVDVRTAAEAQQAELDNIQAFSETCQLRNANKGQEDATKIPSLL